MAKIDFYVLKASGDAARQHFACRLAEKAYRLDNTVHIKTADEQSAAKLDDMLWTFRDGSFVPHEVVSGPGADQDVPVTIGTADSPADKRDLLINLGNTVPADLSSFARIAEIVASDDDSKAQSRNRFVEYREDGHTLETHKL